jgi:hypothetical protein
MSLDVADKTFDVATKTGDVAALTWNVATKTFTVADKIFDVGMKTFDVADKTFEVFGQKIIGKRLILSRLCEKQPRLGKTCRFPLPINSNVPNAAANVSRDRPRSVGPAPV